MRVCFSACVRASVQVYVQECVQVYERAYLHSCVRTSLRWRVCSCIRARVCVCACVRGHTRTLFVVSNKINIQTFSRVHESIVHGYINNSSVLVLNLGLILGPGPQNRKGPWCWW